MWDLFQSFGLVFSFYRTWLEGNNMHAMGYTKQCCAQAPDCLLPLHKMTTSSLGETNSTSLVSLASSSSSSKSLLLSASPLPLTGGGNVADRAGYALVTGALSGIRYALRYYRKLASGKRTFAEASSKGCRKCQGVHGFKIFQNR